MPSKRLELTGQTFNRWTVIRFLGMGPTGGSLWECRCRCGTIKPVLGGLLVADSQHAIKSCGCLKKETDRQNGIALAALTGLVTPEIRSLRRRTLRPYEALYNATTRKASARGLSCGLTYETFCGLVAQTQCHYCYGELYARPPYGPYRATQLDRKDNAQGYEEGNVVSCCSGCNKAKGRKSYEFAITQRELWRQLRGDRMSTHLAKPKRIYTNAARFERRSVPHTQEIDFATSTQTYE